MQNKNARTLLQQKIDSKLLQAINDHKSNQTPARANRDSLNINEDKTDNLNVDINAEVTDDLIARIKTLGGKVIYPATIYHTIRAEVPLSIVEAIARYQEVKFIQQANVPLHNDDSYNTKSRYQKKLKIKTAKTSS
ncbi:MAG: hypothetical protein JWQ40_448 [Segetibacter sp.]|nr:hypothetical protein [Segetibacter sp.]